MPDSIIPTERVTLTRDQFFRSAICGILIARGEVFYTLERPWIGNINSISCIPVGEYECEYRERTPTHCNVYRVERVPGRTGILIHSGNLPQHSRGCILLGLGRSDDPNAPKVVSSRDAMAKFIELMKREPFILSIVNKTEDTGRAT